MDRKLVAWARMVKTRSRGRPDVPRLWLFTDRRLGDPATVVRRMASVRPAGLFGVVLRGEDRVAHGVLIAQLCRQARIGLVVADDVRLARALGAGVHLPSGRRGVVRARPNRLLSASAHDGAELRRAVRAGAGLVFVSPVFATGSHPGARPLGSVRAARLARSAARGVCVQALGGIDGRNARRLSSRFGGAGAISALSMQPAWSA